MGRRIFYRRPIIPDLLRGGNGATGHCGARMIGALANHFRGARHVASATHGRTFARALKGNSLDLIIDQARRGRDQTGSCEVRIGIHAGHDFGLVLRAAGRKEDIRGKDVNGGHGGHADGDKEVSSFHFQFQFGAALCGTDFP